MILQGRTSSFGVFVVCPLLASLALVAESRTFNFEVEKRISERLDFFLSGPRDTAKVISSFRRNGGFPSNMDAADRDEFLALAYGVTQPLVYFGLEDGTCPGYYWSSGYYREPGNSGYAVDDANMELHLNSCVDSETGAPIQCLLAPGSSYISCKGGADNGRGLCETIEPCPNQTSCASDDHDCNTKTKWCRQYDIVEAPKNVNSTGLGYVPITNFCLNDRGQFTQEAGVVLDPLGDDRYTKNRTSCRFGDGSLVQRNLTGAYAACGGGVCSTVFAGGYSASEYDPRYRPWYITTKETQKPNWMPPFAFFTLGLGITYSEPIYTIEEESGRQIFAGVVAVDYRFEDIADFLVESYSKTDTAVVIFEVAEPRYVIAASTGSPSSKFMLSEDLTKPCPVDRGEKTGCEPVRLSIQDFGAEQAHDIDSVLAAAAALHKEQGYPQELLVVKVSNGTTIPIFVSQSTVYTQEGTELSWRVVVVEPGVASTTSALTKGDPYYAVVCVIAALGCCICFWFVTAIYRRRAEKAIVYSDWRFTCAFIAGCIFFNSSSFTLLGENTKATCLLRMWSFHFFFVATLSPLFVKVWRMYTLVGSLNVRRSTITNMKAALYTLPMIMVQTVFLMIFTFVDPPRPMDDIDQDGGSVTYGVVCGTDTNAYFYTLSGYEAVIVFVGCVLAYKSRNMPDEFGEAKQMIFSMYNIFFVGLVMILVVQVTGLQTNERSVLQAVGVFWGTVVSASAFVIPRLLMAQEYRREQQEGVRRSVHISGIDVSRADKKSFDSFGASRRASSMEPVDEDLESAALVLQENAFVSTALPKGSAESAEGDVLIRSQNTTSDTTTQVDEESSPPYEQQTSNSTPLTRIDFTGTPTEIESNDHEDGLDD